MLEFIRERATGVIAWIIVIGITLTFALFGLGDYLTPDANIYVAEVDGKKIMQNELQRRYLQNRARLQATLGENFNPAFFSEDALKRQALDSLIEENVLLAKLSDSGQKVGNQQLSATIQSLEAFKTNGVFDNSAYQEQIRIQGESVEGFEQRIRRAIMIDQAASSVVQSSVVSDAELDAFVKLRDQQREISFVTIPRARFIDSVEVSDDDIRSYYDENSNRYQTVEQVSIEYLVLDANDYTADIEVEEEDIQFQYEERKAEFVVDEQRRASHILLEVDAGADEAVQAEIRAKAQALLDRANAGEDFAELAKANSEDAGSAGSGGDLGFFGKGVMVPAFEEAVFALEQDQISDLVQSSFGFHIIKLTGVQEERGKTYDEVKVQLENELKRDKAADIVIERSELLVDTTYENPETLSVAAEQLGIEIQVSELFERGRGIGIASDQQVREAAFSDEVAQGNNSEVLQISGNRIVVLREKDREEPATKPLEEVRDQITANLKDQAANDAAKKLGAKLLADIESGSDVAEQFAANELSWSKAKFYSRHDGQLDQIIAQDAFKVRQASEDARGIELRNGDYSIVKMTGIKDGDPASLSEEQRQVLKDQRQRAQGNSEYTAWLKMLKSVAKITLFEENI
ncbi:MAG: SurA N-terminal domain-containing protein [Thiotrichales bacterium]|nr:SurA N-terminal domain-containing protein [Thiotrichales bacterium]